MIDCGGSAAPVALHRPRAAGRLGGTVATRQKSGAATRDMETRGQTMKARPTGVIPPMTTPFRKDGETDLGLVRARVDCMFGAGAQGVAAGGSTGEGHTLDPEEYRDLMAAPVEAVKGRIAV